MADSAARLGRLEGEVQEAGSMLWFSSRSPSITVSCLVKRK
jgi:hypothetical protein